MNNRFKSSVFAIAATAMASALTACGAGGDDDPDMPTEVRMQWFGYTNHHVQMGKVGVLMDAAYAFGNQKGNTAIVPRVVNALKAGGSTVDYMVLGHDHGDHSVDMDAVQQLTGAKYYAMASACDRAKNAGVACETIKGGETIKLGEYVTMYPYRYIHNVKCDVAMAADGGIETIGYLFVVRTTKGRVAFVLNDSGIGGPDASKEVIVNGENRGSAFGNLAQAMKRAEVTRLDFSTLGPEQRPATQAVHLLENYYPKVLYQNHQGWTGVVEGVTRSYDLLQGLHYTGKLEDSPHLARVMKKFPESKYVTPSNYFDAYSISVDGFQQVDNTATKAAMGLPASGPGPLPQSAVNLRNRPVGDPTGIDCPSDEYMFANYP